jgi:hypothetical protein
MRHAAVRRWPSTAGIWRQPSARRKRIWPLATRPRSTTSAASSSAGYLESSPAAGAPRRLPLVLGELDEREQFLAPLREAADDAGAAAPPLPLEGRGAALGRREAFGVDDPVEVRTELMKTWETLPMSRSRSPFPSARNRRTRSPPAMRPTMGTGAPERRASLLRAGWVGDTTPCECSADLARHGPRPRRIDYPSRPLAAMARPYRGPPPPGNRLAGSRHQHRGIGRRWFIPQGEPTGDRFVWGSGFDSWRESETTRPGWRRIGIPRARRRGARPAPGR